MHNTVNHFIADRFLAAFRDNPSEIISASTCEMPFTSKLIVQPYLFPLVLHKTLP